MGDGAATLRYGRAREGNDMGVIIDDTGVVAVEADRGDCMACLGTLPAVAEEGADPWPLCKTHIRSAVNFLENARYSNET